MDVEALAAVLDSSQHCFNVNQCRELDN